jgi:hypothetical protein
VLPARVTLNQCQAPSGKRNHRWVALICSALFVADAHTDLKGLVWGRDAALIGAAE